MRLALLERGARVMTSPSLRRSEALRTPSWRRSETRVVGDGTRVSRALPTRPCLHASTCPCASPHACPYACTHRCARKTLSGTVNLRSVGRPFPFGEGEGAGGRDFLAHVCLWACACAHARTCKLAHPRPLCPRARVFYGDGAHVRAWCWLWWLWWSWWW